MWGEVKTDLMFCFSVIFKQCVFSETINILAPDLQYPVKLRH